MRTPVANYTILAREPEGGSGAPIQVMNFDSLEELTSFARRVHSAERVAKEAVLRTQVRIGVMLLQVRPQIRHGQWRSWLMEALKLHYKTAHRYTQMAFRLADSKGELSTERLRELMVEFEKRENVGDAGEAEFATSIEEMPEVSLYKVQRAMGMRKPHNPCCALPPLMEHDRIAVEQTGYLPLALEAPRPAVVVDGKVVQPSMTFQEIQERLVETAAAPASPNVTNGHKSKRLLGAVAKAVEVMHRMISNFENSLWAANDAVAEQIYTDLRALEDRFQRLVTS